MNVKPLFKLMVDKKASDLFFTTYAPVMIKIDGKIMPVNQVELTPKMVRQAALELMNEQQLEQFTQRSRDRLRDLGGRARPVPRQRVPPARQRRDGAAVHHAGIAAARRARHARHLERHDHAAARLDPDGRRERLGQVDDAGGDDRLPQQELGVPHRHDRGPDRVPAQQSEIHRQPARGRARHVVVSPRAAQRDARGTRRHPDRRDSRPRDDAGRHRPRRHGPPRDRDAAREQLAGDARPHHQHVSERSAQAGADGPCRSTCA